MCVCVCVCVCVHVRVRVCVYLLDEALHLVLGSGEGHGRVHGRVHHLRVYVQVLKQTLKLLHCCPNLSGEGGGREVRQAQLHCFVPSSSDFYTETRL